MENEKWKVESGKWKVESEKHEGIKMRELRYKNLNQI
jgi:hypothetical protein